MRRASPRSRARPARANRSSSARSSCCSASARTNRSSAPARRRARWRRFSPATILPRSTPQLEEAGRGTVREGELILKRSFSLGGSNRQFVNGSPDDARPPENDRRRAGRFARPARSPVAPLAGTAARLARRLSRTPKPALAGIPAVFSRAGRRSSPRNSRSARRNRRANRSSICCAIRCPKLPSAKLQPNEEEEIEGALPAGEQQPASDRAGDRGFAATLRERRRRSAPARGDAAAPARAGKDRSRPSRKFAGSCRRGHRADRDCAHSRSLRRTARSRPGAARATRSSA